MTVIAYRRGVIAADSMAVGGEMLAGSVDKIAKSPEGHLAGGAGDLPGVVVFLKWVRDGCKGSPPEYAGSADWLLVGPNKGGVREMWYSCGRGDLSPFNPIGPPDDPFVAVGSGQMCAAGAMWAGASAVQAVEAAIALTTTCGGEVRALAT